MCHIGRLVGKPSCRDADISTHDRSKPDSRRVACNAHGGASHIPKTSQGPDAESRFVTPKKRPQSPGARIFEHQKSSRSCLPRRDYRIDIATTLARCLCIFERRYECKSGSKNLSIITSLQTVFLMIFDAFLRGIASASFSVSKVRFCKRIFTCFGDAGSTTVASNSSIACFAFVLRANGGITAKGLSDQSTNSAGTE